MRKLACITCWWYSKMRRVIVIISSIALLFNCTSKKENNYLSPSVQKAIEDPDYGKNSKDLTIQKEYTDLIKEKSIGTKDFRPKGLKLVEITKEDVIGIWKADYDDGPNATLAIYEDSILNVEHFSRYEYELKGDTLIIDFGDWRSLSIVTKAVEDTLILIDENGEIMYTTFKD